MIQEIWGNFWFSAVKDFLKTRTLYALLSSLIVVGIYVFLVIYIEREILQLNFKPNPTVFSLLGLVLGLLLVFRTNTAYDRWWEGRRMLGTLVNDARNLALKLSAYLPENAHEERKLLSDLISNYGLAMKEHLRNGVQFEVLKPLSPDMMQSLKKATHVPNAISLCLYDEINKLYLNGLITREQFLVLDRHIASFTDIVGGCERIKNTPIPFSYSVHLKKFIFLYILILPFGITSDLGYWSVFLVMLVFYAFTGLELIGEEIEDPFGTDVNDLPTDAISAKIAQGIEEILVLSTK